MKLGRSLARRFNLDLAGTDTTLITGSGRSGTSWLANICNYRNDFRYLFEPLNPSAMTERSDLNAWCLTSGDKSEYLEQVLFGKVSSPWIDSRNRRFVARRRLIKEIRTNLMLGWIRENYPDINIVMIVRNPIDVALSRATLNSLDDGGNWVWKPSLSDMLSENNVKSMLSKEEFQMLENQLGAGIVMETIADWCINNLLVWRLVKRDALNLVFYEDLVSKPKAIVKPMLEAIKVQFEETVMKTVQRPSETTRKISSGTVQLDKKNNSTMGRASLISQSERFEIDALLDRFGIRQLYTEDWSPVHAF